ncbi:MAG TPA: hypothetical protein PKJ83_13275 [Cyclobacteriaceae bacterium]|nr:hypothetical protein [Cyclobacteriaceae bacterium]
MEKHQISDNLSTYTGKDFIFNYPCGENVITIKHADGTSGVRIVGKIDEKVFFIDIELFPLVGSAKDEITRLSEIKRITVEQESISPTKITICNLIGWRYVYRLFEGGTDYGYLETVMMDTPQGVYRVKMNVPVTYYNRAKITLNTVLGSLRFIE